MSWLIVQGVVMGLIASMCLAYILLGLFIIAFTAITWLAEVL